MVLGFAGVVFDLDGLLLDTERLQLETGPEVISGFGYELAPEFFYRLVGVDRMESARLINLELGSNIDGSHLAEAWSAAMDSRMLDAAPLRPGVHAFLDAIDENHIPRAVATNSMTKRAEWKLSHAGLLERMSTLR